MIPLMLQIGQLILLLTAQFLLASLVSSRPGKRMAFMGLTTLSYPVLLFTLMMEQYIVAVFWTVLTVYLLLKRKQAAPALWGAGGTLLTSLILAPGLSDCHPVFRFRDWFRQMLDLALGFLMLLLLSGRLEVLLDIPQQLGGLTGYTGAQATGIQKLWQYSGFFLQTLLAPEAGPLFSDYPSWQLAIPSGFSAAGLCILLLCIVSFLWNRKNPVSIASALWLLFSFLMLFVIGWGIRENGLILYSLYFAWPVWILLFQLSDRLTEKLPHFSAAAGIPAVLLLALGNIPPLAELIQFCCTYYPL